MLENLIPYKKIRTRRDLSNWCKEKKQKIPIFKKEKQIPEGKKDYLLKSKTSWGETYERFVDGKPFEEINFWKNDVHRYVNPKGTVKRTTYNLESDTYIFQDEKTIPKPDKKKLTNPEPS